MSKSVMVAFLLIMLSCNAFAADKVARCEVFSQDKLRYKGRCLFSPEAGGSFTLSNRKKGNVLFDSVTDVSVVIIEKGVAEVRGLTIHGNNSRWGEAKRSQKDTACWDGEDFTICVR
jgi:hypothetical protein